MRTVGYYYLALTAAVQSSLAFNNNAASHFGIHIRTRFSHRAAIQSLQMAKEINDNVNNGKKDGHPSGGSKYERMLEMAAARGGVMPTAGDDDPRSAKQAIDTLLQEYLGEDANLRIEDLKRNPKGRDSSALENLILQAKGAGARNPRAADDYLDQLKRGSRQRKREQTRSWLQEAGYSEEEIERKLKEEFDAPVAVVKDDGTVAQIIQPDFSDNDAYARAATSTATSKEPVQPPTAPLPQPLLSMEPGVKKEVEVGEQLPQPTRLSYQEQLRLARAAKGGAPPAPATSAPTPPPLPPSPLPRAVPLPSPPAPVAASVPVPQAAPVPVAAQAQAQAEVAVQVAADPLSEEDQLALSEAVKMLVQHRGGFPIEGTGTGAGQGSPDKPVISPGRLEAVADVDKLVMSLQQAKQVLQKDVGKVAAPAAPAAPQRSPQPVPQQSQQQAAVVPSAPVVSYSPSFSSSSLMASASASDLLRSTASDMSLLASMLDQDTATATATDQSGALITKLCFEMFPKLTAALLQEQWATTATATAAPTGPQGSPAPAPAPAPSTGVNVLEQLRRQREEREKGFFSG